MEENNTSVEQAEGGFPKSMIVIALVLILVLAGGVYAYNQSQSANNAQQVMTENTQQQNQAAATPTVPAMQKEETASTYKDGTYEAEGQYISPGGEEQLGVSLTLKDGVITDATVTPKATRPISVKMQTAFSQGYKPLVVGKNIDEVQLDVVSGSSLSPKGFNDAVKKIKEQAKA